MCGAGCALGPGIVWASSGAFPALFLLTAGLLTLTSWLVGIVFLMTTKPSLAVSILAMLIALAAGAVVSLAVWRFGQPRELSHGRRASAADSDRIVPLGRGCHAYPPARRRNLAPPDR